MSHWCSTKLCGTGFSAYYDWADFCGFQMDTHSVRDIPMKLSYKSAFNHLSTMWSKQLISLVQQIWGAIAMVVFFIYQKNEFREMAFDVRPHFRLGDAHRDKKYERWHYVRTTLWSQQTLLKINKVSGFRMIWEPFRILFLLTFLSVSLVPRTKVRRMKK